MGNIGITEILIIVAVLVLLFGARKIPELMRGMGTGIREFKSSMNAPVDEKPVAKDQPKVEKPAA